MGELKFDIKRFHYFRRHFLSFLTHLTFKKVINLILNEIEMRLVIISPKSLPPYLKIEPTPLCQLRCIACGQSKPDFRKQFNNSMHLSLEELKKIIDPISSTTLGISFSVYGEPLLNKNLISMIKYISSKNIGVSFPTNFSVKLGNEEIKRLAKSGLDSIVVSLDGASEDIYNKYRIGGNFNLILKNVKLLSDAKKRLGLKKCRIIWKFIVFDYNKHEVEIVKKQYKSLGFDSYEFVSNFQGDLSKNTKDIYNKSMIKNKKPCYWLWNTIVIRWDGTILPCCSSLQFNLGNAIEENIKKIWNNEKYKTLREGFSKKRYGLKMHPLCIKCFGK